MELTLPPASLPHFGPHCEAELPAVCAYGRFQGKVQEVFLRAVLVKGAGELTQETMQGGRIGNTEKEKRSGRVLGSWGERTVPWRALVLRGGGSGAVGREQSA